MPLTMCDKSRVTRLHLSLYYNVSFTQASWDAYHSGEAGDEFDRVLHFLLCHLHHSAVLLLQGQGVCATQGHPGVHLYIRPRSENATVSKWTAVATCAVLEVLLQK